MEHDLTLQKMADDIGIDCESIVYAYIFGSRLYGCHRVDSDYDIMVVVDGYVIW